MKGLTLVLDNLRSCHNVGSIIRTANGFGCSSFIFLGTTPYPKLKNDDRLRHQIRKQTLAINKTALGSEKEIKGQYFQMTEDFLKLFGSSNLICLEQSSKALNIKDYRLSKDINFLVLGGEIKGVSPILLNCSQADIYIPMIGNKESFNVAVAAGIALYHLSLQL